jgi:hypothetical protein
MLYFNCVASDPNAYMIDNPGHTSQYVLDNFIFDSSTQRISSGPCGALLLIDDRIVKIARGGLQGHPPQKRRWRAVAAAANPNLKK